VKVIEFLKEHGVEALKQQYQIIVKEVDDLLVLNYNQIESPKADPIVMECRSLIIDADFNIVSRSFSRFFNFGEAPDTQTHLDFSRAECYEKVDGSLIKIYNHKGKWHAATRGTAYADSDVNGWGITFKELVLKALDCEDDVEFQLGCNIWLDEAWTYIFEITSAENRVVKRYDGYTLHYLASRHNQTGEYGDWYEKEAALTLGAVEIKSFKFDSVQHCIETAKTLPNLEEGYVVYQDGVPVCKIKSPAYLAVHAIRGEGLTPKRIMQLVLMNEQSEYLTYFPEDEKWFTPYVEGLAELLSDIAVVYDRFEGIVEQKEFALSVKDYPFSAVLFQARNKKQNVVHTFHEQTETYKMKVLEGFVNA
jgi:T4 RnlA family RNA ligase